MDYLRMLVTTAKAWYDSKTKIDKLAYTVVIVGGAYLLLLTN
jgi:hypothetical protein